MHMRLLVKVWLISCAITSYSVNAIAQERKISQLEKQLKDVVARVHPASVYIWDYDPITKTRLGGNFSGVAVDANGTILTAAHACKPKQHYLIVFPNGQEHEATCLGTIRGVDAAVIKINERGSWPYAEMGWSSSLQVNQPVLSIAYPGSYNERREVIRFGYVSQLNSQRGRRFTSTCLMEPGDSGGPVFDLFGRVVGIHSSIDKGLSENFEVPVDLFRKYWTALQDPQAYVQLPAEDSIAADPLLKRSKKEFVAFQQSCASYLELEKKLDYASVNISSVVGDTLTRILGTLLAINGKTYVLSKSSMVGDVCSVGIDKDKVEHATVIKREVATDLVLLGIENKHKGGIKLESISKDTLTFDDLGELLISPNPNDEGKLSVLGTTRFRLKPISSSGYFGAGVEIKEKKVFFNSVNANSPASAAKISVGSELVSINGLPITDIPSYISTVQSYSPGDVLTFVTRSNERADTLAVKLGIRPMATSSHVAERFTDGKSIRRDGFPDAFAHDATLKPAACGGPVFDIKGRFVGVNIARLSRTSSIAIPAHAVRVFLQKALL